MESGFAIEVKFIWAIVFETELLSVLMRRNYPLDNFLYRVEKHFLDWYDSSTIAEYLANWQPTGPFS